jgi:hypothetical protein
MPKRYTVDLTSDERGQLVALTRKGKPLLGRSRARTSCRMRPTPSPTRRLPWPPTHRFQPSPASGNDLCKDG